MSRSAKFSGYTSMDMNTQDYPATRKKEAKRERKKYCFIAGRDSNVHILRTRDLHGFVIMLVLRIHNKQSW
jgi:hypothetical protein